MAKGVSKPKVEVCSEEERLIMREFVRSNQVCIHHLNRATGLSYPDLLQLTTKLTKRGKIYRKPDTALGKTDYQYCTREPNLSSDHFMEDRLSPLVGLSESEMQGRVVMLKRMLRLLIPDWHPIINVILGDYERDLLRLKLLREPPEDGDAFDVLDRDFEKD